MNVYYNRVSPAVEVILGIRKDLAEFQRTLGKKAWRAMMRAACEATLWSQVPDLSVVTEHLRDRGFRISDDDDIEHDIERSRNGAGGNMNGTNMNGGSMNGTSMNGKRLNGAIMRVSRFYQPKGLS
jgi:hypothetical protein